MTPSGTKGGQGRRAEQVEESGVIAAACGVLLIVIVAVAVMFRLAGLT